MTAAKQIPGEKFLKTLAPLGDLDAERFSKITKHCKVESYDAGEQLFAIGDRDNRTIYLTSGQISLTFRSGTERIITAETNQARNALVPEQPRQATAVAKTPITILVIDTDALDQALHWDDSYEVAELETDDNDWMTMFLQSKAFLKLRAQNIQALMMRLEEIPVKAGQKIVKQGDDDGFYYIIKRGKCRVSRKPANGGREIEIAILGVGNGFGEEALIMRDARGATVTMIENGQLMRLSRSDFTRLLAEPLVQIVSYKEAIANSKNIFVDVRSYDEYEQDGITDSEHSPLAEMRARIQNFDHHKQYVLVSNDGGRASAAAFLLCQQGLDAVVLERGVLGLPDNVDRGNGGAGELENIPVIDNVVDFQKGNAAESQDGFDVYDDYDQLEALEAGEVLSEITSEQPQGEINGKANVVEPQKSNEKVIDDPRVNAIFARAKERVVQEAKKAKVADQARAKAEQGLQNLKQEAEKARVEAEKARQEVESASLQSAEVARLEAIKEAARLREVELGCKQAEVEEAIRQAEEEAQRAHASEQAYKEAQEENARLKREMEVALARTKEESRKSVEALKIFSEQEERHFAKMSKRRAREEEKRTRDAEKVRIKAEKQLKSLQAKADKQRSAIEELNNQIAVKEEGSAEWVVIQEKLERFAEEKIELDAAIQQMLASIQQSIDAQAKRSDAVAELEALRQDAEDIRSRAAEFACIAADNDYPEAEQLEAKKKAKKLAELQLEREEAIRELDAEIARKQAIEDARIAAEDEIQRIRENAAKEKARIEERALKIAEAARREAEMHAQEMRAQELAEKQNEIDSAESKAIEEAERAWEAEQARLKAEKEIEKLKQDADQTRQELERQLSADIKRSEIEHEVARVRAEELVNKQAEIDEISKATEKASLRAMAAEEAKLNAEQEIERLKAEIAEARAADHSNDSGATSKLKFDEAELYRKQQEILEIGKTLEEEARRVQAAEAAQIEAQEEITRLRGEVESLTRQAQQQLNNDVERAAVENASVREQARELEQKQQLIEEAIEQAQREAQLARDAIEAKVKAEAEAKKLKAQANLLLSQAKEMVRKSKEEVREQFQREIDQARAEGAARRDAEIKEAVRKTKLESRRAEAAEKARLAAEREIERLKVASEVNRIKAEKAIKDSIKTASRSADNRNVGFIPGDDVDELVNNQQVTTRQRSGSDFFSSEPQNDLEAQDEMNLLFTSVSTDEPSVGAMGQIKAMSNKAEKPEDELEEEAEDNSSAWVSDQVMWEATLGIREDEKAQTIVAPRNEPPTQNYNASHDSIQAKQVKSKAERQEDKENSLFSGRDVNPMAIKTSAIIPPIRRRQIAGILKKAKILLWLSPLIVAIGYYFSLEEKVRIDMQLKIAKSVSGIFGGKKDIAKDAERLIKETEERIAKEKETTKAASKAASKPKTGSTKAKKTTRPAKTVSGNNSKSFAGKDIPFQDTAKSRPVVSAPLPTAGNGNVASPAGQPVLPPLPDATPTGTAPVVSTPSSAPVASQATTQTTSQTTTTEVITSVDGVAVGRVVNNPNKAAAKPTSGRTSLGVLPPAELDAGDKDGDINADQNSATFHKK